jgi:hypothetical protein
MILSANVEITFAAAKLQIGTALPCPATFLAASAASCILTGDEAMFLYKPRVIRSVGE